MKISICIPTCNRANFLKEALISCFLQSYLPYEIIIGDDSGNDYSEQLVKNIEYPSSIKIKYFKNSPPLGQADNVNALIDMVDGDKMVLLHDDDLLLQDALQKMKSCFDNDPEIDAVFGKQYIINEKGVLDEKQTKNLNQYFFRTSYHAQQRLSSVEAGIVQQFPNDAYMIDAQLAKKVKYRQKEAIGNAGDFDFGFRLGIGGYKLYFLNEFTAKYRITAASVARSGTDSGYQSFKIIAGTAFKNKHVHKKVISKILSRKAPIAIMQALQYGKREEAMKIYFGKHHRKKIFTLGGIRRFLFLLHSSSNRKNLPV